MQIPVIFRTNLVYVYIINLKNIEFLNLIFVKFISHLCMYYKYKKVYFLPLSSSM